MKRRLGPGTVLLCAGLTVIGGAYDAAAQSALKSGQELFQKNRWDEARRHLRSKWSQLSHQERLAARFVIGRSYVREAELYRWVRVLGSEVGLDYLGELGDAKASRRVRWLPLFTGFYQLAGGRDADARRTLNKAAAAGNLPAIWKTTARLRSNVAGHRLGRAAASRALVADNSHEGRYWRLVLGLDVDQKAPAKAPTDRDRIWAGAVLFRQGDREAAEKTIVGVNPDQPGVEDAADPKKVLRFFDPAVVEGLERVLLERGVLALLPLLDASGSEQALARFYVGASLYYLGAFDEARELLEAAVASPALGAALNARARVLIAATRFAADRPTQEQLDSLWQASRDDPEAVVLWTVVQTPAVKELEPFASQLPKRLAGLAATFRGRVNRATVGRWGLARLQAQGDATELVAVLTRLRDNANKNKIEWNDPLLLLAVAAANYRNSGYAQSLETLFALSEVFPGLRGLHWNLQGTYAARQKAGGEARISQ